MKKPVCAAAGKKINKPVNAYSKRAPSTQLFLKLLPVLLQQIAVGFVVAWVLIFTWITLKLVSLVTPLRVEQEDEIEGLDITQHEEISYHL